MASTPLLWATVSPLNEIWQRNPFNIRITLEGLGANEDQTEGIAGIRLIILGSYFYGDDGVDRETDIIVPATPANTRRLSPDIFDTPPSHEIPTIVLQLRPTTDPLDLQSKFTKRLVFVPTIPLRQFSRSPVSLPILFDRVYPIEYRSSTCTTGRTATPNAIEIGLRSSHCRSLDQLYQVVNEPHHSVFWPLSQAPVGNIHLHILSTDRHSVASSRKITLVTALSLDIVQAIAWDVIKEPNLANGLSSTSTTTATMKGLLSMALTQKAWLPVLDHLSTIIDHGLPVPSPTKLASLLKRNKLLADQIGSLNRKTFFTGRYTNKPFDEVDRERKAFISVIQRFSRRLKRLIIDPKSLRELSENPLSDGLVWEKLEYLECCLSGERKMVCGMSWRRLDRDTVAYALGCCLTLRLFPGLRHLNIEKWSEQHERFGMYLPVTTSPVFNLETLTIKGDELSSRQFKSFIQLNSPNTCRLQSLHLHLFQLRDTTEMRAVFHAVAATLRELSVELRRVENQPDESEGGSEGEQSSVQAGAGSRKIWEMFDALPEMMRKLRTIKITAALVREGIIGNMSRSRARDTLGVATSRAMTGGSEGGDEDGEPDIGRSYLEIHDIGYPRTKFWDGVMEESGSNTTSGGRQCSQLIGGAIGITGWDTIVFQGFDARKFEGLWSCIREPATMRGYAVTRGWNRITMKRE